VLGRLIGDPEGRRAHGHLGDDRLVLVSAADPVDLDRVESRFIELDRRAAVAHGELGHHRRALVPAGRFIHLRCSLLAAVRVLATHRAYAA